MKPSIQDVVPALLEYYKREGNGSGGIFHIIIEDINYQKCHAVSALEDAKASGDALELKIAELLVAMSSTQRRKLSASWYRYQAADNAPMLKELKEKYGPGSEPQTERHSEDDSSFGM
jgi:hypothetical protein